MSILSSHFVAIPCSTFHLFSQLPTEIQLQIWKEAAQTAADDSDEDKLCYYGLYLRDIGEVIFSIKARMSSGRFPLISVGQAGRKAVYMPVYFPTDGTAMEVFGLLGASSLSRTLMFKAWKEKLVRILNDGELGDELSCKMIQVLVEFVSHPDSVVSPWPTMSVALLKRQFPWAGGKVLNRMIVNSAFWPNENDEVVRRGVCPNCGTRPHQTQNLYLRCVSRF